MSKGFKGKTPLNNIAKTAGETVESSDTTTVPEEPEQKKNNQAKKI